MKKYLSLVLMVLCAIGVNAQSVAINQSNNSKNVNEVSIADSISLALAKATVKAHGGDKFKNMKTLVIRGTADVSGTPSQVIPATFAFVYSGEKYRVDIINPFQTLKQIYDGEQTFSSINGFSMPPLNRLGLPLLQKIDDGSFVVSVLPEKLKKKKGFRVTSPEGYYTDFLIDEKSGQVKSYQSSYDINGRMVSTSVEIDKVRNVDGVFVPENYSQRFDLGNMTIYTSLGFSKGNADGAGSFPMYSYDLSNEYGNSFMDVRHNFFMRASITMPWKVQMSPFIIASSGRPFNITTGLDSNRDSIFNERPTFTQLNNACVSRGLTNSFCDISDASNPNDIIPRNYGRGPAFFSVNMNVNRTFGFGKSRNQVAAQQGGQPGAQGGNIPGVGGRGGAGGGRGGAGGGFGGGRSDKPYNLTVGLQFNNLFNRTNFGTPIGNLSSDRFGQSTSTAGGFGFFGGGGGGGGFGFFSGGGGGAANRRVDLQLRFSF